LSTLLVTSIFVSIIIPGLVNLNIAYSQVASINIDSSATREPISPFIFGNNINWIGLGDGIWDPLANSIKASLRPLVNELKIKVMRFPGGTLSDKYVWYNGIGNTATRGYNPDYIDIPQKSLFGTDEFHKLLNVIGAEGLITVNVGTGTAEDAANWVEYCNGSSQTSWGKIRVQHGYPEPFAIKHWELGNELYGSWEPGNSDVATYAQKVTAFVKAMRQKDSSIKIGAVAMPEPRGVGAKDTIEEWNKTVLETAGEYIDFLAIHPYQPRIDGKSITFFANNSKTFTFQSTQAGENQFIIRAKGTPVSSVYPVMECSVDNESPHQISVNTLGWANFIFQEQLNSGTHQLTISFVNDANNSLEDRNLFVKGIEVQGPSGSQLINIVDPNEFFKTIMASAMMQESQIQKLTDLIGTAVPQRSAFIKIAATEFNAFYGNNPDQVALCSDFKSALLSAELLQVFLRNQIYMANFWDLISGTGLGAVKGTQVPIKRPSYHVLSLLSRHQGNVLLDSVTVSPTFSADLCNDLQAFKDIPYLSVVSSISPQKDKLVLSVINKHQTDPVQTNLTLSSFNPQSSATVLTLTAAFIDSTNESNPDTVTPIQTVISNASSNFTYNFPPQSLTIIEMNSKDISTPKPPAGLRILP
jgi:alpha-L-arabinofuranosidase